MTRRQLVLLAVLSSQQYLLDAFVLPTSSTTKFTGPQLKVNSPTESHSKLDALPEGLLTSASSVGDSMTSSPLFSFFLETVIAYAVPALFTVLVIAFAASSFRRNGDDDEVLDSNTAIAELYSDLYGESKKSGPGSIPFGKPNKPKIRNLGIPSSEYIKISNLNEKYESYDFSINKATKSKAFAAAEYRSKSFDRALKVALEGSDAPFPAYAKAELLEAEKTFLKKGSKLVNEIQEAEKFLAAEAIDGEIKRMGLEKFELDPKPIDAVIESKNNVTLGSNQTSLEEKMKGKSKSNILKDISKLQREVKQLELDFIQSVIAAVGPERAVGVKGALLGDIGARGSASLLSQLEERPLSSVIKSMGTTEKKRLFVMDFPGDVTASQLNELREEVTAIVRNAKPGDEALIVLQSGGGTVTGYGLAAGQLVRLKEKGLFLTIAVEQVAASGGYLMSCVADRIIASPFAVLGSIGVISEIPNGYERLKKEGIEFQTVTAGKFKRSLTPTKKVTKEDFAKAKEDVEMILVQFANFVKQNRPSLDVDSVATGETWFGDAAVEKGLCDEIKTVDDVLLNFVDSGYDVYQVEYKPPQQVPEGLAGLLPTAEASGSSANGIGQKLIGWAVKTVAAEVESYMASSSSVENRYMAKDDSADRIQVRDRF